MATPTILEEPTLEPQSEDVTSPPQTSGPTHSRGPSDDPQTQLIATLRSQINDLFTQVTQLNSKLVSSYDRVSDLEDSLHVTSSNLRQSTLKISQLELERTQHLSALNTGLLVEKSQVTAELTRLMERATEEAASRSSAVQAKQEIEKELDDLSANLFDQANTMVAEARLEKAKEEEKRIQAERRLGEAEEVVKEMGRTLRKAEQEREMREKENQWTVAKGKWTEASSHPSTRLLSTHVPYQEFLLFVAHLRGLHSSTPLLPAMSTLLPLPFLARLMSEDSDPTLRLDLAPSLNWLSRRSVLAAIHTGNLTIEPISTASLIQSYSSNPSSGSIPGLPAGLNIGTNNAHSSINCALCGTPVFPGLDLSLFSSNSSSSALQSSSASTGASSWFKRPSLANLPASNGSNGGQGITPPPSPPLRAKALLLDPAAMLETLPPQVYVFRITTSAASAAPSTPAPLTVTTPSTASSTVVGSGPPPVHPRASRARSGTVSSASHMSVPSTSSSISTYSQASQKSPSSPFTSAPSPTSKAHSTSSGSTTNSAIYPLCIATVGSHASSEAHSWCLTRLRATCSLWAFVRGGIVERVWDEEVAYAPSNASSNGGASGVGAMPPAPPMHPTLTANESSASANSSANTPSTPPRPPRKRGLWGTLGSLGERAANWSSSSANNSRPSTPGAEEKEKRLPPAPALASGTVPPAASSSTTAPPPLPRRNEGRAKSASSAKEEAATSVPPSTADAPFSNDIIDDQHGESHELVFSASPHHSPLSSPRNSQEAARIPLPESRPATPQTGGTLPPSRTASPAPGGAPGAAGAPPPIPRRAVGRGARPMSISKAPMTVADKSAETSDSSKEPISGTVDGTEGQKDDKAKEEVREKTKEGDVEVRQEGAGDVKQDTDVKVDATEPDKREGQNPEGQGINAENADGDSSENAEVKEGAQEEEKDEKKAEDEKVNGTETAKVNGAVTEVTEGTLDKKEENTDVPVESASKDASLEEKIDPSQESNTAEQEGSGYPYVGSTTWEERTWKEIIRLKEGMYWARVGGVQAQ
ncbi:hypothetical protein GYMLUDRAFT_68555 [Collybiopsis luxurians FD-317 M1]|nr:hypothetical protein GYMLUDRAFT_68555 [Collybiopsis luxurians FD-317 M1]